MTSTICASDNVRNECEPNVVDNSRSSFEPNTDPIPLFRDKEDADTAERIILAFVNLSPEPVTAEQLEMIKAAVAGNNHQLAELLHARGLTTCKAQMWSWGKKKDDDSSSEVSWNVPISVGLDKDSSGSLKKITSTLEEVASSIKSATGDFLNSNSPLLTGEVTVEVGFTKLAPYAFLAGGLLAFTTAYLADSPVVKVIATLLGGALVGGAMGVDFIEYYHSFIEVVGEWGHAAVAHDKRDGLYTPAEGGAEESKIDYTVEHMGEIRVDYSHASHAQGAESMLKRMAVPIVGFLHYQCVGSKREDLSERFFKTFLKAKNIGDSVEYTFDYIIDLFKSAAKWLLEFLGMNAEAFYAYPVLTPIQMRINEIIRGLYENTLEPSQALTNELFNLKGQLDSKMGMCRNGKEADFARFLMQKIEGLHRECATVFSHRNAKAKGAAVLLVGGPGVGKTVVLNAMYLDVAPRTLDGADFERFVSDMFSQLYYINTDCKHNDGAAREKFCMIDDALAWKDPGLGADSVDPSLKFILHFINEVPYMLPMADLANKGKHYANYKGIFISTNLMKIDETTAKSMVEPRAIQRRLIVWHITLNERFCKLNPDGTVPERGKRAFDVTRLPDLAEGEERELDMDVYEFFPHNIYTGVTDWTRLATFREVTDGFVDTIRAGDRAHDMFEANHKRLHLAAIRAKMLDMDEPMRQRMIRINPDLAQMYSEAKPVGKTSMYSDFPSWPAIRSTHVDLANLSEATEHRPDSIMPSYVEDVDVLMDMVKRGTAPPYVYQTIMEFEYQFANNPVMRSLQAEPYLRWCWKHQVLPAHSNKHDVSAVMVIVEENIKLRAISSVNDYVKSLWDSSFLRTALAVAGVLLMSIPAYMLVIRAFKREEAQSLDNRVTKREAKNMKKTRTKRKVRIYSRTDAEPVSEASLGIGSMQQVQSLRKNIFSVHINGEQVGYAVCPGGRRYVMPHHFIDAAAATYEDTGVALFTFKCCDNPSMSFSMTWKDIVALVEEPDFNLTKATVAHMLDQVYFTMPDKVVCQMPDITKHFATEEQKASLAKKNVMLVVPPNITWSWQFITGTALPIDDHCYQEYTAGRGCHYAFNTKMGFCGAPLFEIVDSGVKLLGLHTWGNGYDRGGCTYFTDQSQLIRASPPVLLPTSDVELDCVSQGSTSAGYRIGTVTRSQTSQQYTSITSGAMSGCLGPLAMEPARLKPFFVGNDLVDPMVMAHTKYCKPYTVANQALIDDLVGARVATLLSISGSRADYQLTFDEANDGYGNLRGIPRTKSMGSDVLFMKREACVGLGKQSILGKDTDLTVRGPYYEYAKIFVLDVMKRVQEGENVISPYMNFLKDEVLSSAKVARGDTRLISGAPYSRVNIHRQVYGDATSQLFDPAFVIRNGHSVGVNPMVDWDHLARLHSGFDGTIAADYKHFDGRNPPQFMYGAYSVLDGISYLGEETQVVREWIKTSNIYSTHVVGQELMQWTSGQSSGDAGTLIINGESNLLMTDYALSAYILEHYEDKKVEDYVSGDLDFQEIKRSRFQTVCGDDSLLSVRGILEDVTSGDIAGYLEPLGISMTNADKTSTKDNPLSAAPLTTTTFLKRGFRPEGGSWDAPLDLNSIKKMMYWVEETCTEAQYWDTIQVALNELSLHGREVFDSMGPVVVKSAMDKGYSLYPNTWVQCRRAAKAADLKYLP